MAIRDKELHNNKNINLSGRYNNSKYIYAPNNRVPKDMKQKLSK